MMRLRHKLTLYVLCLGWPFLLAAQQTVDSTFRITPVRPVEELRKEALAAQPPRETGPFRKPELVELIQLDPTIKLDIRYATTNNFLSTPMYSQARAFMQRPAADALVRAHQALKKEGYGLLIHDAYRPWYVTKMFWEATPEDKKIFVADPKEGSKHNRGCAVDLTRCMTSKRARQSRCRADTTRCQSERTRTIGAARRSSASAGQFCGRRWRRKGLRCIRRSGGTLITRIGNSTR